MSRNVYVYHSGQPGIPSLTAAGGAGQLAALLYACGVTGFGSVTLDSLSHTNGVATATRAAGLGLADGLIGYPHTITISGSSNGWDGEYTLSADPSSTTCTFAVNPALASPATGTISIKRAPAGMVRHASASNQEIYQFSDTSVCPGYLMLDDANAQYAGIRLAETYAGSVAWANMQGLCPTVAQRASPGGIVRKTDGSGSAARPFVLLIWKGGVWFQIAWNNTYLTRYEFTYAGAHLTRKLSDQYPGMIIAGDSTSQTYYHDRVLTTSKAGGSQNGHWLQRASSQAGSSIFFTKIGNAFGSFIGGVAGTEQSNIVEGGADDIHGPIHICEGTAAASAAQRDRRGILPGMWDPLCSTNRASLDLLTGMANLAGRRAMLMQTHNGSSSSSGYAAFDIDGPWGLDNY